MSMARFLQQVRGELEKNWGSSLSTASVGNWPQDGIRYRRWQELIGGIRRQRLEAVVEAGG